jgi:hypothetical protein
LAANIPAPFNLLYLPGRFVVPGNATATAQNITAGETTYRIGLLCGLVCPILWVFLILSLYSFLKDVDRKQARLMVLRPSIMITLALVNLLNQMAPLILPQRPTRRQRSPSRGRTCSPTRSSDCGMAAMALPRHSWGCGSSRSAFSSGNPASSRKSSAFC